jgi:hypothetical protein
LKQRACSIAEPSATSPARTLRGPEAGWVKGYSHV